MGPARGRRPPDTSPRGDSTPRQIRPRHPANGILGPDGYLRLTVSSQRTRARSSKRPGTACTRGAANLHRGPFCQSIPKLPRAFIHHYMGFKSMSVCRDGPSTLMVLPSRGEEWPLMGDDGVDPPRWRNQAATIHHFVYSYSITASVSAICQDACFRQVCPTYVVDWTEIALLVVQIPRPHAFHSPPTHLTPSHVIDSFEPCGVQLHELGRRK